MNRHHRILTLALGALAACSGGNDNFNSAEKQGTASANATVETDTVYSGKPSEVGSVPSSPLPVAPAPQAPIIDEPIAPPKVVTGAFLHCEEISDPKASATQKEVGCTLKALDDMRKIDIAAEYSSANWTFNTIAPITAVINVQATNINAVYHAVYKVTAKRSDIFANASQLMMFTVNLTQNSEPATSYTAELSSRFARWASHNGVAVKDNFVKAGTEQNRSIDLRICRIHYNGEIIPGKLSWNSTGDKNKTVCFASMDNDMTIRSNLDGSGNVQYPSDALAIENLKFDDLLEWISAENGKVPPLAFLGGVDAKGRVFYLCQALETSAGVALVSGQKPNDPKGEYTPGFVRSGDKGCSYNYYGLKTKTAYRVLTWKSSALKSFSEKKDGD